MAIWKTIKSKKEYNEALVRISELIDVVRTEATQNELTLLTFLVSEYEAEHKSIPDASPLEVIRFIMEMKGIQQKDLVPILGTKGYVSKILSGAANLQLDKIDPLSKLLGIPVEALIPKNDSPYTLVGGISEEVPPFKMQVADVADDYRTERLAAKAKSKRQKSQK